MTRKGNPISVRLEKNRSSDSRMKTIIYRLLFIVFQLFMSFVALSFRPFLGSEGIARMTTPEFLFLLFIVLITLILSYRIILEKKRKESWILIGLIYFLISFFSFLVRFEIFEKLVAFIGIPAVGLYTFVVSNSSISTGSEDFSSSTTISIESSDSLLSHSDLGAQNPEPANNILSHFGNQDPNLEIELYARIRLLESRLIDLLPPQLNVGEYEALVRDNLNQAINIQHYHSALSNEIFDITVLELKANLQDQLFNLLLSEPDDRLIKIFRESPFPERAIRTEALEFIELKMGTFNLENARSRVGKIFVKVTLRNWINLLQEHGHRYHLYQEFLSHFRGES